MGLALMPDPGGHESFVSISILSERHCTDRIAKQMYTFPEEEDLVQLVSPITNCSEATDLWLKIEIIRPLRIANLLDNVAQIRHSLIELAVTGKSRSHFYQKDGQIPDDVLQAHLEKSSIGKCSWIYYGTTYGPPTIRQYKLDIVHKEFTKILGARRIDPSLLPPDHYFFSRARIAAGEPDLEELSYLD